MVINKFTAIGAIGILLYGFQVNALSITYNCNSGKGCRIANDIQAVDAGIALNKSLHDWAAQPVESLLKKNISGLGTLSLNDLLAEISTIRFMYITRGYTAPQGRMTGFMYKVEDKTVYFTADAVRGLIREGLHSAAEAIFLHESLGALGYVDDDYQISSLIMALNSLPSEHLKYAVEFISKLDFQISKRIISPSGETRTTDLRTREILAAGGSTTIGGGGDPVIALLKMRLMRLILENKEPVKVFQFALNEIALDRTLMQTDLWENKLEAISSYPLSYDTFLRSVRLENHDKKPFVLLGIFFELNSVSINGLEIHLLNFIKNIPRL